MIPKTYSRSYPLTAADCNSRLELPLWTLGQNIVEVATDHANLIGVGYSRLVRDGHSWVLMRLTLDISGMPKVGETYTINTWVAGFNRRFSERDFEITAALPGGEPRRVALAHTVWTVIDSSTRQAATLEGLEGLEAIITPRSDVTFTRSPRIRPADFASIEPLERYRVTVSDIDSNRHLTAMRYVQLMLNCLPLEFYDRNDITRFEIAYSAEARYGDIIESRLLLVDDSSAAVLLSRDSAPLSQCVLSWRSN